MNGAEDARQLGDRGVLIRARRHFKVLRYIVQKCDDLGAKLVEEPSTYEGHLTVKRIKLVLGRYGPTESTLAELVALGYLEKRPCASGKRIYLPTSEGKAYLARLRFHLEGLNREIRSYGEAKE